MPPVQQRTSLGVLAYCFSLAQANRAQVPGTPDFSNPIHFIEGAARVGGAAVQIPFGIRTSEEIREIRDRADQLQVELESTVPLPRQDAELAKFEAEMRTLHELGVKVCRTVIFPGRRYEDFSDVAGFKAAFDRARAALRRAEPAARKWDVRLAIENHKDQRIEERVKLFQEFGGEHIGACVDVGNNMALLENPVDVARALAPWALTVHFKDQAVRECEEGFLLADIPLGQGCIDLPEVIRVLRAVKPKLRFQLELITRDALIVPVLQERYWGTFPDLKAGVLASTWAMVKARSARDPFPVISRMTPAEKIATERRNIEESFQYAAEHLDLKV